ncbi:helix-turn-helix domain-containing protein [Ligilactobacillus sp.]|uniref:helix-turn-helix domain-containing protein n=1 Tax=Ligilactobacillus sp. TaxID=2767921 RepID=UPI002FE1F5AD
MINLNSPDILTVQEAARIWGKNEAYVRTALKQSPDRFPNGSVRRFGKVILVTTQGMEAVI